MPKAFLFTNKRYDLYNLNIPRIWCKNDENEDGDVKDEIEVKTKSNNFVHVRVPVVNQRLRTYHHNSTNLNPISRKAHNPVLPEDNEKEWTLVIDEDRQMSSAKIGVEEEEEQPVNLSIKKIDLFNLTQLAEVRSNLSFATSCFE